MSWNLLYRTTEVYEHGDKEYEIQLKMFTEMESIHYDKKIEILVYRREPIFFGLTHSHTKVGTRSETCSTSELPEIIEKMKRRGKEVAHDHAQELEAIRQATAD